MGPSFRLGGSTAFVTLHDRDGECLQAAEGVSGSAGVVEPALIARELLVAPDPAHGLVGLGARPLQIGPVLLRITGNSPDSITESPHLEHPGGPLEVQQWEWDSPDADGVQALSRRS